ncbi:MAG: hypothetical protein WEG36_12190 [Gemmatimonadota bacterium]
MKFEDPKIGAVEPHDSFVTGAIDPDSGECTVFLRWTSTPASHWCALLESTAKDWEGIEQVIDNGLVLCTTLEGLAGDVERIAELLREFNNEFRESNAEIFQTRKRLDDAIGELQLPM